jgi:hypothetical protein
MCKKLLRPKKHISELTKTKKRAIAKGSGGRPRTIIKTIEAIADSGDSSDGTIRSMLDTFSAEANEKSFMDLFYYLSGQRYFLDRDILMGMRII